MVNAAAFTAVSALPTRSSAPVSRKKSAKWFLCSSVDLTPQPALGSKAARLRGLLDSAFRPLPAPITLQRRTLKQPFAVALMRSGYNAVDALDIVGMDTYQRVFFDVRSRAWERYLRTNFGVRQGALTDARYFDFISYAQMRTTQRFVAAPNAVFEEAYQDEDGHFRTRVVRSTPRSPEKLLDEFRSETGRRIVNALGLDNANNTAATLDQSGPTALRYLLGSVYGRFEDDGFCFNTKVALDEERGECRFEMVAPAILWGARALRTQRGIANDYDVWACQSLLSDVGIKAQVETSVTENSIVRLWRVLS